MTYMKYLQELSPFGSKALAFTANSENIVPSLGPVGCPPAIYVPMQLFQVSAELALHLV